MSQGFSNCGVNQTTSKQRKDSVLAGRQAVTASGGFMQPDTELGATAPFGNTGNLVMYFCAAKGQNYFLSKKIEIED